MALDLRTNKPEQAASPAASSPQLPTGWTVTRPADMPNLMTSGGMLPLPAATPIRVTPDEEAYFKTLGIEAGDPIPAELGDIVAHYKKDLAQARLPVPPDTPKHVIKETDIRTLPSEKQAELKAAIRAAVDQSRAIAAAQPAPPPGHRLHVNPNPAPASPVLINDIKEIQLKRKDEIKDEPAPSATGLTLTNCPHCHWDLSQPASPDPTPEQKRDFLHALWGGRFRQTYPLYGGEVSVTFRSLTGSEHATIFRQIARDQRLDPLPIGMHADRAVKYWMAASLEEMKTPAGGVQKLPPLGEMAWDGAPPEDPDRTVLPDLVAWCTNNVWTTDLLLRILEAQYNKFAQLIQRLEAQAPDANFTNGISSLR